MPKIAKYSYLSLAVNVGDENSDATKFRNAINDAIEKGWQPYGSTEFLRIGEGGSYQIFQSLVRYEEAPK